jgi:putative SOS response-associated peptidase YedK
VRNAAQLKPRYNLGPQGHVPVLRRVQHLGEGGKDTEAGVAAAREVCIMRWGLVPSFAKRAEDYDLFKGGSSTFNARVEGAESSGLWRRLLDSKRCIVLLDGFYEWKTLGKTKTPMFIRNHDNYIGHTIPASKEEAMQEVSAEQAYSPEELGDQGPRHAPLLLAALYDVWHASDVQQNEPEDGLTSTSILTMEPDGTMMTEVHDRMPVFLTPQTAALWLDPMAKYSEIIGTVCTASRMHAKSDLLLYEVSALVSNIRNESADCILPKKEYDARQLSKGIGRFFQKKVQTSEVGTAMGSPAEDTVGSSKQAFKAADDCSGKRKLNFAEEGLDDKAKFPKVIELD